MQEVNLLWCQFEKSFAKSTTFMIKLFLFGLLFNKKKLQNFQSAYKTYSRSLLGVPFAPNLAT